MPAAVVVPLRSGAGAADTQARRMMLMRCARPLIEMTAISCGLFIRRLLSSLAAELGLVRAHLT